MAKGQMIGEKSLTRDGRVRRGWPGSGKAADQSVDTRYLPRDRVDV